MFGGREMRRGNERGEEGGASVRFQMAKTGRVFLRPGAQNTSGNVVINQVKCVETLLGQSQKRGE